MGNPTYTNEPAEQTADPLSELALDLRWTWHHAADDVWCELDSELWDATRNPWLILQSVPQKRLKDLLEQPGFRKRLDELAEARQTMESADAWFQKAHPNAPLGRVAYFSMEYMLSEALPIYAGGLGNVAGDQMKAASDLNVPITGIGLLYQQGYFRQEIDASGAQVARYPFNDPSQLPIRPLRNGSGDWIRLKVFLPGCTVWIRAWEAIVGRRRLYLLDTNDPANPASQRTITAELYGGGSEMRLRQEAVLGIGGWRLLRALDIRPEICHLNEGHCAFAVLERARSFMEDCDRPFDVALAATRAGNLFTTHTPVEAGFDRFAPDLMYRYFGHYTEERLKIPFRDLMALGRVNPGDDSEPFNMAYLALRGSAAVNGVSRLHGQVSRRLFSNLFPRWPEPDVPVHYITNGVHVPTWDSAEADALWETGCGQERWRGALEFVSDQARCLTDDAIWQFRNSVRKKMVEFTRKRSVAQCETLGESAEQIAGAGQMFDDGRLTMGFARRFAAYKRPTMLLRDPERLIRILTNPDRPVQLVIAGKAHPQDGAGQAMIQQWHGFIRRPEVRGHAAFLVDYDMLLTQELAAGVDLWVNTPRRPWEACGTSGMKVLVNGGLNVSELDGWWAEAYAPEVGWAFGDGQDRGEDPDWDAAEADRLYKLLEDEIVPAFYNREGGVPRQWVARVRESMARLTPAFSANRAVRQYTEEQYLPLAAAYRARSQDKGQAAVDLVEWQHQMAERWHEVRFGAVSIFSQDGQHRFRVQVMLGSIAPAGVRVELYADGPNTAPFLAPMALSETASPPGTYWFSGSVPADRPAGDYTPRIAPYREGAFLPLEGAWIEWQK